MVVRLLRAAVRGDAWNNPPVWPTWRALLPHVLAAVDPTRALGEVVCEVSWLLREAGDYVQSCGEPRAARPLFERAYQLNREQLDADDPDMLAMSVDLAFVLCALGEYEQAGRPGGHAPAHAVSRTGRSARRGELAIIGTAASRRFDRCPIPEGASRMCWCVSGSARRESAMLWGRQAGCCCGGASMEGRGGFGSATEAVVRSAVKSCGLRLGRRIPSPIHRHAPHPLAIRNRP